MTRKVVINALFDHLTPL